MVKGPISLTSPHNPLVKQALKLKKSRARRQEQKIIIEGRREIAMAGRAGADINILFYCPAFGLGQSALALFLKTNKIKPAAVRQLPPQIFQKISYRQNPDGLLAIARRPAKKALADLALSASPLVLVLARIEKPGNLGAIIRTARAAGVEAVILAEQLVDFYNPNVIRASQGNVFAQPWATASAEQTFAWLKEKNICLYAATSQGNINYTKVNYRRPIAVALGAEDRGLSQIWRQKAAGQIKIPCAQPVSSLNVSVAAGIIIYEAWRQRAG